MRQLRALVLPKRSLDTGSWAVDLALSGVIFPYMHKLLQATATDLRPALAFIWASILALDCSCQVRLGASNFGATARCAWGIPKPSLAETAMVSVCGLGPRLPLVALVSELG